jgi:phenylacetate-coenzyme A ligase PaaK-like adenylate-forming protein
MTREWPSQEAGAVDPLILDFQPDVIMVTLSYMLTIAEEF